MPSKKQIPPGEKLPLKLTAAERKLILELLLLDPQYEEIIRNTPSRKPIMMTLDDLEGFGNYIAAEANHSDDPKKEKKLDAIYDKILLLEDTYTEEEPPQVIKMEDARKTGVTSDQVVQIAEFTATALIAAEQLRIKTKPLEGFWLAPTHRDVLLLVPGLSNSIKTKLAKGKTDFTVAEVASMTMAVAEDLPEGDARKQVAELLVAKHLMDCLQEGIMVKAESPAKKSQRKPKLNPDILYQFKITLIDYKPLIWRRIQVQDCTLDKLHEYIQTAMGWTNSHLHQFEIKGRRYGDPELLDDGFGDSEFIDSTATSLSQILPKTGKRFAFKYEYDFGDGWEHEVLFEGSPAFDPKVKYPFCLEGECACPPEDVGGVWGYVEFLEAISNPKHEEHESMLEWVGGKFDPKKFDPKQATKAMKKGLPDWRV